MATRNRNSFSAKTFPDGDFLQGKTQLSKERPYRSSESIQSSEYKRLNIDITISNCGFSRFNANGSYVTLIDGAPGALSRGLHLHKERRPVMTTLDRGSFPLNGSEFLP